MDKGTLDRTTGKIDGARRDAATRRFPLVRYFAIAGLVAFALAAAVLAWHEQGQGALFRAVQQGQKAFVVRLQEDFVKRQDEAARRDLLSVHESGNVNLTRLFANTLWERDFAPFVARVQAIPVEQCRSLAQAADRKSCAADVGRRIRAYPEFALLDAKVHEVMKTSTVFKIKVFDARGITVYSSEHGQVGEDKSANAGWQGAMAGRPGSELTHRDRFSAFEGVVENRDLISSYLPVRAPGHDRVVGVFEVYSDVTPFLAQIRATSAEIRAAAARDQAQLEAAAVRDLEETETMSFTGLVVVNGLLALLFAVLYVIVRRADRLLRGQQEERERARQQLAQSEKLASLGQMVAGVAHQLNTPLAFSHSNVSLVIDRLEGIERPLQVASKFSDLVRRTAGDRVVVDLARSRRQVEACEAKPEEVGAMREMLRDVLHGIDQMAELVAHMRNFTRLDRARTSAFDLNKGLASVAYIARSVIPNRVRVAESYADLPPVECNASQLNQVFLNLISNAAQAIEGPGTVTVSSRLDGGRVVVEVADTGTGIAPEVLPRIFDNYFTTKPEGEGTGLGLTIARDIVRAHGGDIEVASATGKGSIFTVWLPANGATALPLAA